MLERNGNAWLQVPNDRGLLTLDQCAVITKGYVGETAFGCDDVGFGHIMNSPVMHVTKSSMPKAMI